MDRRDLLGCASLAAMSHILSVDCFAQASAVTRAIDTHTHFYDPTREQGVPWPEKNSPLYRAVYPKDWLAAAATSGVKQTIVVEASNRLEDNQWILDLAKKNASIVGFVGNLSPRSAEFPQHLKRFSADPIFRGIRIGGDLLQYSNEGVFRDNIKLLANSGLELDILGSVQTQPLIVRLANEFPALNMVVNHVGNAGDPAELTAEWKKNMSDLGACKNVYCKVSGIIEQTAGSRQRYGAAPRDPDFYRPILEHCWNSFGEDRLIYGSNWPVCEKGGTYADQFNVVSAYFTGKGQGALDKFFWKNATTVYHPVASSRAGSKSDTAE